MVALVHSFRRLQPPPVYKHLNGLRQCGRRRLQERTKRPRGHLAFSATVLCLPSLIFAALPVLAQEAGTTRGDAKVDRQLASRLEQAGGDRVPVLISMRPPPAPSRLALPAPDEPISRAERHVRAVRALRANTANAQASILERLAAHERSGRARAIERFWITNMVRAEVTPDLVRELSERPDVARVYLDRRVELEPGAELQNGQARDAGAGAELVGVASVALLQARVPEAWEAGFTGKGILVANLDSGVQGEHPALAAKWRGLRAPVEQAWFDPYRNTTFPVDDDPPGQGANGHGTATMGLLVGGEQTLGVAYEAEWIAANIFENNFSFVSTIIKGLQWAADPDGDPSTVADVPDVINASFGLPGIDSTGASTDTGLCDDIFDEAVEGAGLAGSVLVFSAGNFNVPDPGDITPPGSSPIAFAVGAVDTDNGISSFSGRGPSLCSGSDAERLKPDIVAPGRSVRTLNRVGGEQFLTGTSFSTPIVGGIAALMRQKNPRLPAEEIAGLLQQTARDLGSPGFDNTFGAGLVDALAAVVETPPGPPVLRLTGFRREGSVTGNRKLVLQGQSPAGFFLLSGENRFLVRVTNPTPTASPAGPATLVSRSPLLEIIDGDADVPVLDAGGETELSFAVRVGAGAAPGVDLGLTLNLPSGQGISAIPFTLVVGEPIEGQFATHDANQIRMTVTNFGAIGFWLGVLNVGRTQDELLGTGFHFPAEDEENFLFHSSFLVGRSPQQVSDDLPYGNVAQSVNDFHVLPGFPLRFLEPGPIAAQEVIGAYDDSYNVENEIGVSVEQHSYAFDQEDRQNFVVITYDVTNRTSSTLGNLRFGLFADWDFLNDEGEQNETMDFVPDARLGTVQGADAGPALGIVALNAVSQSEISYRVLRLAEFEAPQGGFEIREEDKFEFLSQGVRNPRVQTPEDLAHVIAFGPRTLAPGDSIQAAFAFVAGTNLAEARQAAERARTVYQTEIAGQGPPPGGLPEQLTLRPPFPNPFRPGNGSVTLGFDIPDGGSGLSGVGSVELRVLDLRGRVVRTIVEEELTPGEYEQQWDGLDEEGRAVPSGVYVVLLEAGSERLVAKLVVVR
jgi:serine protease AprX